MNNSRRSFLKAAGALSAATAVGPISVFSQRAYGAPLNDYKALVLVFLYGANDNANTVIPVDDVEWRAYRDQRNGLVADGGVAIAKGRLGLTTLEGGRYALNPGLRKLAGLYNDGNAAVIANVGPLMMPTKWNGTQLVRADDPSRAAALPPKLRSHNDQQAFWQSFATEGGATGWGGRIADPVLREGQNGSKTVFTAISAAGSAVFLSGNRTIGYQVSPGGALPFNPLVTNARLFGLSEADTAAVRPFFTENTSTRMFERDLNGVRRRSITAQKDLAEAFASLPTVSIPDTAFAGGLGAQLKMVRQLMRAGKAMGLHRQVFHVALGGFDMHDGLVGYDADGKPQAGTQEALLGEVDAAVSDFFTYSAVPGELNRNEVTLFTGSDFGRTYNPNNDGSDHGWGGHHFVIGGAVKGKRIYGNVPAPDPSSDVWMPRGVLVPTVATQQLAYTLGSWFGTADADLVPALPGIANFTDKNLGFMR